MTKKSNPKVAFEARDKIVEGGCRLEVQIIYKTSILRM